MLMLGCVLYCGLVISTFFLTLKNGLESIALFPNEFEEMIDCNLFGRILLSVISIAINPLTLIARFLYCITHVKKK